MSLAQCRPHGAELGSCSECREQRRGFFEALLLEMRNAPSTGGSALPAAAAAAAAASCSCFFLAAARAATFARTLASTSLVPPLSLDMGCKRCRSKVVVLLGQWRANCVTTTRVEERRATAD